MCRQDYPWEKFGDCTFSRFGSIGWTDTQTDADECFTCSVDPRDPRYTSVCTVHQTLNDVKKTKYGPLIRSIFKGCVMHVSLVKLLSPLWHAYCSEKSFCLCLSRRNVESYNRAACLFELLVIKRSIRQIADDFATAKDNNLMLHCLYMAWC